MYIIVRPTRREREANLAESRSRTSHRGVEGTVRATEEAHELSRQREREGIPFNRAYAVDANATDSKKADDELVLRHGIDPTTMQPLHSPSTRHE